MIVHNSRDFCLYLVSVLMLLRRNGDHANLWIAEDDIEKDIGYTLYIKLKRILYLITLS
jgi:hypothetical protein